jgi:hypothetical protein
MFLFGFMQSDPEPGGSQISRIQDQNPQHCCKDADAKLYLETGTKDMIQTLFVDPNKKKKIFVRDYRLKFGLKTRKKFF